MKKIFNILLTAGLIVALASCEKEDTVFDLKLDPAGNVEVFTGESKTVKIESGNGGYEISSITPEGFAEASVSETTVTVSGKEKGETTVTVKDAKGKTASFKVTVKPAIIDATTPRFKWGNTVELDKTNGWGVSVLSGSVAVTNLTDKKQYILSWTGGYTAGEKSGAKLLTVESGKQTQETPLTLFEIQKADGNPYSIIFGDASQKGELVVTK